MVLLKPMTFMNRSGAAVKAVMKYHKVRSGLLIRTLRVCRSHVPTSVLTSRGPMSTHFSQ